ncbi:MAG: hypothetical protein ACO3DS_04420, partial [Phycisphaerales bacterium]
ALCRDFCVNQKLVLKMDLPGAREPVQDLFGRLRKEMPRLANLERYPDGEVALESDEDDRDFLWVAMRQTSLKSGWVNPASLDDAYRMHRSVLEVAPFFLSISPLDVAHLALEYAFDFECDGNRDEVVLDALLGGSHLGDFAESATDTVIDAQPFLALVLSDAPDMHVYLEVRTRTPRGEPVAAREGGDPLSVMLTVRRTGPVARLEDLPTHQAALAGHGERLVEQRLLPRVLAPLRARLDRG